MAAPLRPDAILLLATGHWAAGVLKGAVAVGLFTQIARGNQTTAALAAAVGGDEVGIGVALNALTVLGLLKKDDVRYLLRPLAQTYLVADSPEYLGELIEVGCGSHYHFELFDDYRRVLERGRAFPTDVWKDDEEYGARLAAALYSINVRIAAEVCDELGWKAGRGASASLFNPVLLDLGRCGGAYGIAALTRLPQARLAALDHPHLLDIVQRFAVRHGVADRLTLHTGDCRSEPLGGPYDAIFMSQLLHTYAEDEQRRLLDACRQALGAGGRLVVVEFLPDDRRRSNMAALLFETMLYGFAGRTYHTPATLRALLQETGFTVRQFRTDGPGGYAIAQMK